ncbi:MAG: radical SAM protein [Elusimicrobia bacterium]|nr:radical SAM protein [Elusimicrobiota bacterium]
MRVLLTPPPAGYFITKNAFDGPPLGLLYLAAALKSAGFETRCVDPFVQKLSAAGFAGVLRDFAPDLVGVSFTTETRAAGMAAIRGVRAVLPGAHICAGGPHPSLAARDLLECVPELDSIVVGEGERTLPDLARCLMARGDLARVPGIAYREAGSVRTTAARPLIADLDTLPFPDRDALPHGLYSQKMEVPGLGSIPAAHVLSSRGCPMRCVFCAAAELSGRSFRPRSPENVVAEIEGLRSRYGIRGVYFYDDTFSFQPERVRRICRLILERRLDIRWFCDVRADNLDRDLIRLMKEAGCFHLAFGVESGDAAVMREHIRKAVDLDQVRDVTRWCVEAGIIPRGLFIVSNPGETYASALKSLDFMRELHRLGGKTSVNVMKIYPGTELERRARRLGLLPAGFRWAGESPSRAPALASLVGDAPVYLEHLSVEQIGELLFRWRRFSGFQSWAKALQAARGARTPRELASLLPLAWGFLRAGLRSLAGRTAAVLLGALAALVLLEAGLRLFGAAQRIALEVPERRPGDSVVLCLGDSFTFGTGAPRDLSYPRQLEKVLNADAGPRRFVVVNGGVPGRNTTQLLEALEADLAAVRPDLVILLAGLNNSWNLKGYHAHRGGRTWSAAALDRLYRIRTFKLAKLLLQDLRRVSAASPGARPPRDAAPQARDESLYRGAGLALERLGSLPLALRAFEAGAESDPHPPDNANLAELARIRSSARNPFVRREISLFLRRTAPGLAAGGPRMPPPDGGRRTAWTPVLNKLSRVRAIAPGRSLARSISRILYGDSGRDPISWDMQDWAAHKRMGQAGALVSECFALQDRGAFSESSQRCRQAIALYPGYEPAYFGLGLNLKRAGRYREAARAFMQGVAADPDSSHSSSYSELVGLRFAVQDPGLRQEIADFFEKLAQRPQGDPEMLEALRAPDARRQEDVAAWIEDDLGRIIAVCRRKGIPVLMQSYPGQADPLSRDVAARNAVPFVDHAAAFAPRLAGGRRGGYFIADGHCNAAGYGLMAKTLRRKMSELGLLGGRAAPPAD